MNDKRAVLALAGLAGLTTLVTPAVAAERERRPAGAAQEKEPAPYAPGELLVRFEDTGSGPAGQRSMRDRAVAEVGGRVAQRLDRAVPGLRRVTLQDGVSVTEAIAALEARDDVAYAEPNYLLSAEAVPNDSRFPELWGLHNTGQRVKGVTGTVDADIDAPAAWDLTKGSANVTVAVLDSGIAEAHPDLAPNLWANTDEVAGNGVDDDGNGFVDDRWGWDFIEGDALPRDEQGHGTHVAGTIGAKGSNDTAGPGTTDVVGVAWNVRLMPLRVLDETGTGSYSHLIAAAAYARQNGAHIANLSLGGSWYSEALRDAFAAAPEVLWVTAAGNDGTDLEYLAHFPCEFDLPQKAYLRFRTDAEIYDGDGAYVDDVSVDCAGIRCWPASTPSPR